MSLTIAVTGINAVDSPGPGVGVLRSLRQSGDSRLIGLAYDVLEPGHFMDDLIQASYILPYPPSGPEVLLERIIHIHEKEKINFIIPTLDAELENFIFIQDSLKQRGIHLMLPSLEQLKMREKKVLHEALAASDIATPQTWTISDFSALQQIPEVPSCLVL